MRRVVYIGCRKNCLKALQDRSRYDIIRVFAVEGTRLASCADVVFTKNDKEEIFKQIKSLDYDILVSDGCPFILPASELIAQGKMLLNTHPTYLPQLRGATPLNGVLYNEVGYVGATTHYISDKIDAGNIIYQEKVNITDDIDLGLVYEISFSLEEIVFEKAMSILEKNNYSYKGKPINVSEGSYFNRTLDKQTINFDEEDTDTCIRKIRSFGLRTQGCIALIDSKKYKLFACERIVNPYLKNVYSSSDPGQIVLYYDDCILIKTIDGLLKVTKYEIVE